VPNLRRRPAELAADAKSLYEARDWNALTALIDDETLGRFAVVGTHDVIAERLLERYVDVATDLELSIAVRDERDRGRLADLALTFAMASDCRARVAITGERSVWSPQRGLTLIFGVACA
jgi:hypothetical protein